MAKEKKSRLEFLESGQTPLPPEGREKEVHDETYDYPLLARYDFLGNGPRVGSDGDLRMYRQASQLRTRGERFIPVIRSICTLLLVIIIVVAFFWFLISSYTNPRF